MKSTKVVYPIGWVLVGFIGVLAIASNLTGDLKYSWEGSPTIYEPNHLIILAIGLGILASAFGFQKSMENFKAQFSYAVVFAITWVFCSVSSGMITLDRMGAQKDDRVAARAAKQGNGGEDITKELLDRAQMKVEKFCIQPTRVRRESRSGYLARIRQYAKECERWQEREKEERRLLALATNSAVKGSGDALAYRVVRMAELIGYKLPSGDVAVLVPLLQTFGLIFLGSVATAWGFSGRIVEDEFNFGATGKAAKDDAAKRFIQGYRSKNGRPPRIDEIINALGVSHNVAQRYKAKYGKAA